MSTHAQVVIAAPNRHLGTLPPSDGVILSKGEDISTPIYSLKDAVGVVALLLKDLPIKEYIIVETGAYWKVERVLEL